MSAASVTSISSGPSQLSAAANVARAKTVGFNAAALRNAAPGEQRTAVAAQFEAILVRQLLGKTLTSMLGGADGVSGSIYGDLLADTLSQQLSAGRGLGLGRFIEQQLTPQPDQGPETGEPRPESPNQVSGL